METEDTQTASGQSGADFPLTDLGNAERLVRNHGRDLKHCGPYSRWYQWDGKYWQEDVSGGIMRCAKDSVRRIHEEANRIQPEMAASPDQLKLLGDLRARIYKHALKSEENHELKAMIELAESEEGIPITPFELDRNPFALCVQNGVVDLKSGKLLPHARDQYHTKISPIAYDPKAKCPRWEKFLLEIFNGDDSMVQYIQRAIGYSLSADVREQVLFFCYGIGANGKSTFMNVLSYMAGDYAQRAPRSLVQADPRGADRIPNDVARLKGARLVSCNELEEGKSLAEATIKDLTGGDRVVARFMRGEFFEFDPTHKLWMLGNHRPEIRGTDNGIWRRVQLIPFTVSFGPGKCDPDLPKKLYAELGGILAWAVRGCMEWQKTGLKSPEKVRQAVAEYRQAEDRIGMFLDDNCVISESSWISAKGLYDAYCLWCETARDRPVSNKLFGGRLRDRGFNPVKNRGERGWQGLTVKQAVARIVA